jgi:hypothetical protein
MDHQLGKTFCVVANSTIAKKVISNRNIISVSPIQYGSLDWLFSELQTIYETLRWMQMVNIQFSTT